MTNASDNIMALGKQLLCYRQLARLSELQREYVQRNQTDELITVLQARAKVLGEIQQHETLVAPLKRNWPELSQGLPGPLREKVAGMLVEAKSLLQQITQADQDDVLLLQQRKLNLGKEIQAATTARKINTRYATAAYGASSGSRLNVQQ